MSANVYCLGHLSDRVLAQQLKSVVASDRRTTAEVLAHIAEVEERKLYRQAAYPSMEDYCMGELHMSEDGAGKRVHAARAARRIPQVFAAVAEGRLHLSAVVMLAPRLTSENAHELIAAATHKTKSQIERLIAARFPRPDLPEAITPGGTPDAPGRLEPVTDAPGRLELVPDAPGRLEKPTPRDRVQPLSAETYGIQFTISQETHDLLREAQELLGRSMSSRNVGSVFERALRLLVDRLRKQKYGGSSRPRRARTIEAGSRRVPTAVRQAVWERDGGQCTFVSGEGQRCPGREALEFDHIEAFARGGRATVSGVRLLCRAHNQLAAERTYGADFMQHKRREAAEARVRAAAEKAAVDAQEREIGPALRELGFRRDDARRAAALCATIREAPLEERIRLALKSLAPRRGVSVVRAPADEAAAAP